MSEALALLAEPIRRRILELLATDPLPAGEIAARIRTEFGISQPAVSQHLRTLREGGLVSVTVAGRSRVYRVEETPLKEAQAWFDQLRQQLGHPLEALATEIERGKKRG